MSARAGLDVAAIRKDFPILEREIKGKPLVYLDTAASAPTVPASPQPFMPMALAVEGTGSDVKEIIGRSAARGMA